MTLRWKCSNPRNARGTIYHVSRSINGMDGPYAYIGGSGQKRFVDNTIPIGVTSLTYEVHAVRTNAVGQSAYCNVHFGVDAATARQRAATPSFQRAA